MTFLDEATWRGKAFSGGWRAVSGGEAPVREPATGAELGRVGVASPADIAAAATAAAAAQPAWAALPHTERAAVLRRAGDLWNAHAEEIEGWSMREAGKIGPRRSSRRTWPPRSATRRPPLPSPALRRAAADRAPHLSWRRAGPGRRRRRHLAVQRPADPGDPVGGPGARARQRGDTQARPAHRGRAAAWCSPASSRRPGCPRGCCTCCPAARTPGRRWSPTRWCGSSRSPARPRSGRHVGALAGQHLKRVHLELGGNSALIVLDDADVDAAGLGRRVGLVPAPGPDLHDDRPAPRARVGLRRVRRRRWRARPSHLPVGDPASGQVALGPIIDERQRDKIHGLVTASVDAGARLAAGGTYDGLFYRPTVLADVAPAMPGLRQRGVRAGGPGRPVLHRGRGGQARRGHRVRAVPGHPHPRRAARPRAGPTDPDRHRAHQRPDRGRRGEHAVRRRRRLGHRCPLRRHAPTSRRSPIPSGSRCAARSRPTRSSWPPHPRSRRVPR